MPAKIDLTEKQISEIETLAIFLTQQQMADYFGICKRTFANMIERDERILINYNKGRAKGIAKIATGLFQRAMSGDTASAIFYLKTQAGWRETQVIDNKSSDGSMSPAKPVKEMTKEELETELRAIGVDPSKL